MQGTFTALVTPFEADGERIDFDALDRLVEAQIAGGVNGLVPCGTTGEAPTLSDEEQLQVIERVAKVAAGRAMVLAGTGSNSTRKTMRASQAAVAAGADGVMVVMPYYNKPSQRGLSEHVVAVAGAVRCPVVLYNIPGRSVVDLGVEATVDICKRASNVVALKDATGNVLRCQELKAVLGERLAVMSGDDGLTVAMMAVGASGVISVSSNVAPAAVSAVPRLMREGKFAEALQAHQKLLQLHESMFREPNPAPCKAALAHLGAMNPRVRLPLLEASEATQAHMLDLLSALGMA